MSSRHSILLLFIVTLGGCTAENTLQRNDRRERDSPVMRADESPVDGDLAAAVLRQDVEATRRSIKAGASPNARTRWRSVLWQAAADNSLEIVSLLLRAGANVNDGQDGDYQKTPLMAARSKEVAEMLVQHKAALDTVDGYGWTALAYAAMNNDAEVAKVLLSAGANPSILDNEGNSAEMLANRYEAWATAKILRKNAER